MEKKNIPVLPHPPYSPDLAPCDFCTTSKAVRTRHVTSTPCASKLLMETVTPITVKISSRVETAENLCALG